MKKNIEAEAIEYIPYEIAKAHSRPKKGHEQRTFYNIERDLLVDIYDNPVETIKLTPEEVEEFRTRKKES